MRYASRTREMQRHSAMDLSVSPSGVPMRETGIALVAVGLVTLAITGVAHYALLDRARPVR